MQVAAVNLLPGASGRLPMMPLELPSTMSVSRGRVTVLQLFFQDHTCLKGNGPTVDAVPHTVEPVKRCLYPAYWRVSRVCRQCVISVSGRGDLRCRH
jgi:hypothetical protein